MTTITIPNILTVIRILLTPVFIIVTMKSLISFALLIFLIAALTDALDGFIARYFDQRSNLGAHLDPIADKMLLTSSFISLSVLMMIPNWLTVIVISRDIIILFGMAVCSVTQIKVTIKPSLISKMTTFFQLITILLILFQLNLEHIETTCFWLTAFLTIISGLHYVYKGLMLLHGRTLS